jgi:hypothetical protein
LFGTHSTYNPSTTVFIGILTSLIHLPKEYFCPSFVFENPRLGPGVFESVRNGCLDVNQTPLFTVEIMAVGTIVEFPQVAQY